MRHEGTAGNGYGCVTAILLGIVVVGGIVHGAMRLFDSVAVDDSVAGLVDSIAGPGEGPTSSNAVSSFQTKAPVHPQP